MTGSDKVAFRADMLRAGAAFQVPVDDAMLAVYFEGLADLNLDTLREAFRDCVEQLKWFPKVVDLRDAEAGVRARQAQVHTKQLVARAPEFDARYCTSCEDTGFVRGLDCPGDGRCHVGRCGHPGHVAYPHGYTRLCSCRATNPVLARQRERLRAHHHKAEARDGHRPR